VNQNKRKTIALAKKQIKAADFGRRKLKDIFTKKEVPWSFLIYDFPTWKG
jgi:hypothetical protein